MLQAVFVDRLEKTGSERLMDLESGINDGSSYILDLYGHPFVIFVSFVSFVLHGPPSK
jgi:hypothetical protein